MTVHITCAGGLILLLLKTRHIRFCHKTQKPSRGTPCGFGRQCVRGIWQHDLTVSNPAQLSLFFNCCAKKSPFKPANLVFSTESATQLPMTLTVDMNAGD